MLSTATFSAAAILLAFHVVGLALLVRNQRWMAWPPSKRRQPSGDSRVVAVVPARNEAEDIRACIESLLAQDYPNLRIVALNDHSADGTGEILSELDRIHDTLTVIHDPPLRKGWLGKHSAMQTAFEAIDADIVLLTDADVTFAPDCVSVAVAELESYSLDLLSVYPTFVFKTFCETMLLPNYVGGAALLLSPSIEDPKSKHAMAVGAFILVRMARLRDVEGFTAIKQAILDDVGLALLFKKRGFKIGVRSAPDLMRVRFFKSNRHAFFGVTKHLLGLVQNALWLAPILAILPALMYGTLLFAVGYGIVQQQYATAIVASGALAIHYIALLMTRPANEFNPITALAFPFMAIQFAASCLRAMYLLVAKGAFSWRGRTTELTR